MKRAGLIAAAILFLAMAIPSFAQQAGTSPQGGAAQPAGSTTDYPTSVYYKVVPLMKVYTSALGYVVTFFSSDNQVKTVYLPMAWFNNGPSSKADIVFGLGPTIPYMAIFWADGKFDHVTLYASSDDNARSNGLIAEGVDLSKQFDVQEIPRNF